MPSHTQRQTYRALAVGLAALTTLSTHAASYYTLTDLGSLPGGSSLDAYGLNDSATVVGYGNSQDGNRAFVWQNGSISNLGAWPDSWYSGAASINNAGVIVGSSGQQAVQWSSGQISTLPALPGSSDASATAINQPGDVVGSSGGQAVVWRQGQVSALPTPSGNAQSSIAIGINDNGTIVGRTFDAAYQSSAVVWQNGQTRLLDTPAPFTQSVAIDVNNRNQIVGYATQDNVDQALLWEDGHALVLAPIAGDKGAAAFDINDAGQIVGFSVLSSSGEFRAALWDQGETVDLGSQVIDAQGWSLSQAQAINAAGQIVGWGSFNGVFRSYLLTPTAVPEAQSSVMLLMGLTGLGVLRQRQHKARAALA
jgi:probable HAF family extracellular repeat protein